jgi:hypothetical protein
MPQATRRWISEKGKSLSQSHTLPFSDILDAEMVNSALDAAGVTFKERIGFPSQAASANWTWRLS